MNKLLVKVSSGVAGGLLFGAVLTGAAFANTTVSVTGNGYSSHNTVNISTNTNTVVNQSNSSEVSTTIHSNAETGDNNANGNTGGSVGISTGSAYNDITVGVGGSKNTLTLPTCSVCNQSSTNVTVSKNGSKSKNTVNLSSNGCTFLSQTNESGVFTGVSTNAETGDNNANGNTNGNVHITTSDAGSTVGVLVTGSVNKLN